MAGPSSAQMKADLDVLGGVSSKMVSDYEQLQSAIKTLRSEAETHSATWSGEAKNAWNGAMESVNTAWDKLNAVLDEIATNINTSGTEYSGTDSSNAASIHQVPTGDITSALVR
ncbi:WXG100 family type VII secretion target [Kineosporia sp. J2-2]|uniref:WXG100 family type VII secretion target n=1 Tax=Kineosporia corallincola TaxID=2835133 RepID=A0ABS5TAN1_9ACTN|nr:WXG100 family type VII secretion target [Kineosporia corallincola]MBT0768125.1 WXG100 family type VII secretion target [Kineosporia corallincola]